LSRSLSTNEEKLKLWACQVADYKESGLSLGEFCKTRGIPVSTFTCHRRSVEAAIANTGPKSDQMPAIQMAHIDIGASQKVYGDYAVCLETPNLNAGITANAPRDLAKLVLEVLSHA